MSPKEAQTKRKYSKIPHELRVLIINDCVENEESVITKAKAAKKYHLCWQTVDNIVEAYLEDGRVDPKPRGGRRKSTVKLTDEHEDFIVNFLDEDCTKTLGMMRQALMDNYPNLAEKGVAINTVWSFLVHRIGFTLKRTKAIEEKRNEPEQLERRKYFVGPYMAERGMAYKTNCIFVDEAGFNATLIRGEGWSKKGNESVVKTKYKRALNITILAGISYNGLENISAKIVKGGTNGKIFADYLGLIFKTLDDTNAPPQFFVMDNASIHKAKEVKALFEGSRHRIALLPPYSPFLNPVEECFSKLKTLVKRKPGLTPSQLREHIRESTNEITTENCKAWVEHSIKFYSRCSRGLPTILSDNPDIDDQNDKDAENDTQNDANSEQN